jgi:hypothetical protein
VLNCETHWISEGSFTIKKSNRHYILLIFERLWLYSIYCGNSIMWEGFPYTRTIPPSLVRTDVCRHFCRVVHCHRAQRGVVSLSKFSSVLNNSRISPQREYCQIIIPSSKWKFSGVGTKLQQGHKFDILFQMFRKPADFFIRKQETQKDPEI